MWYKREIAKNLTQLAGKFPVTILTGARQTGKSSLLRALFPGHSYVSLDIPSIAEKAEQAPEEFFSQFPPPILIDEVQYAPGLFRHIKVLVDQDRHTMGQFILTGSQKFVLMQAVSDSLAGRCALFELEGLSLTEISQNQEFPTTITSLVHSICRGSFPELWRDPTIPPAAFYSAYLATYLERDVRQILNVTSLRDFERFLRACAVRTGQLLDKSSLAADVGVSSKAINSWLSVLVASNQLVLLEPWFANLGKRLVKTPKLYFTDTGLVCHLLGITPDNLVTSPFLGSLWETAVCGEIRRSLNVSVRPSSLWFYRDNQQREVDFLLLAGGNAGLFECKWAENPSARDAQSIRDVMRFGADKQTPDLAQCQGFVVSRPPASFPLVDGIMAIPLNSLRAALNAALLVPHLAIS